MNIVKKFYYTLLTACFLPFLSYAEFDLSVLEGKWSLNVQTQGGVSDVPGKSISAVGLISLNKKGVGKSHFISVSSYDGTFSHRTPNIKTIVVNFTDKKNGIIEIFITSLDSLNNPLVLHFVGVLMVNNQGKVDQIIGNLVEETQETGAVVSPPYTKVLSMVKQYELKKKS